MIAILDPRLDTGGALTMLVEGWGFRAAHVRGPQTLAAQVDPADLGAIVVDDGFGGGRSEAIGHGRALAQRVVHPVAVVLLDSDIDRLWAAERYLVRLRKPVGPELLRAVLTGAGHVPA